MQKREENISTRRKETRKANNAYVYAHLRNFLFSIEILQMHPYTLHAYCDTMLSMLLLHVFYKRNKQIYLY